MQQKTLKAGHDQWETKNVGELDIHRNDTTNLDGDGLNENVHLGFVDGRAYDLLSKQEAESRKDIGGGEGSAGAGPVAHERRHKPYTPIERPSDLGPE